jgi:LacI family transcriptional regulator
MEARPDFTVVSVNNYAGGKLATEHLLQSGYRKIGHISGPLDWWEARQRKQAWQDTLGYAGIQVSDQHWSEGNWSSSSGEQAIERLFQQYPDVDGVFVANDQMAISVLQAACRRGIKVPEQLGVVGFDGIAESAYLWPPLTTVSQDQQLVGSLAVEEIINIVEANRRNKPLAPRKIVVEPELIVQNGEPNGPPFCMMLVLGSRMFLSHVKQALNSDEDQREHPYPNAGPPRTQGAIVLQYGDDRALD